MRRASQEALNKTRVTEFYPLHEKEAIIVIDGMLQNPKGWEGEFRRWMLPLDYLQPSSIYERRMAASTILSVAYDHPTVLSTDHPTVREINKFNDISLEYALPGNYLVEFFTWMMYIPSSIAKWKRVAEERQKKYSAMFEAMFREVEDRIVYFGSLYFT